MELTSLAPLAAAITVAALLLVAFALVEVTSTWRLVRCPEGASMALLEVSPARPGSVARVRRCDLWPALRGCAQGCLARCPAKVPRVGPSP